ncbi:MAG: FHA domain-containing protein [Alphaproteobacteria bacterium]
MSTVYRIGRSNANDIVLADSSVSRVHAELHIESDGRFSLVDLSSTNGTFVRDKGRWIEVETAHVEHGERVLIGDVVTTVTALVHQAEARHAEARKLAVGERPAPQPFRPKSGPPRPSIHLPAPNSDEGSRPIIFGDSRPQREPTAIGRKRTALRTPDPPVAVPAPALPQAPGPAPGTTAFPTAKPAGDRPTLAPRPAMPGATFGFAPRVPNAPPESATPVDPAPLPQAADRSLMVSPPPLPFDRDGGGRRRQIAMWTIIAVVLTATAVGATYAYLDWHRPTAQSDRPPAPIAQRPADPSPTDRAPANKATARALVPAPADPRTDSKPYADPTALKPPRTDQRHDALKQPLAKTAPPKPEVTKPNTAKSEAEKPDTAKPGRSAIDAPPPARALVWERLFGGKGDDVFHSVAVARDNGYLAVGTTNSRGQGQFDLWAVRLDADGRPLWDKTFGGKRNDYAVSAKATPDGGFIVAGTTESQEDGKPRIWLLKLSPLGIVEWERFAGARKSESADTVIPTVDGGYAVIALSMDDAAPHVAARLIKFDAKGKQDWTQLYGVGRTWPSDIRQTYDGGYMIVGTADAKSDGRLSLWALRLDSTGRKLWERRFPGKDNDAKPRLRLGVERDYWMAMNTEPATMRPAGAAPGNVRIVRLNDSGAKLWEHLHAMQGAERIKGFVLTPKGIIVAGSTNAKTAGKEDLYLLKLDNAGKLKWERRLGGPGFDLATDVHPTGDGHMIVVGRTDSRGNGNLDGWILRVDGEGRL